MAIFSGPASLSLRVLFLLAAVQSCQAALSAWWTDIGPQLMLQNTTTGEVRYSACNSYDTPIYSYDDNSVFALSNKPKNGTPLAGTGYYAQGRTVASIFYLDVDNNVVNALFYCNMTSGLFAKQGSWVISGDAPSINENSGLAGLILGATTGYRVYFHDANMTLNELGYLPSEGVWSYHGIISQDVRSSNAIHAAFSGKNNISVVTPRDSSNIEVTRANSDNTWHITTLPHALSGDLITESTAPSNISINSTAPFNFTLPAWNGTQQSMGISIDSAYTRNIWYIGNDKALYQIANKNYFWSIQPNQSSSFWPAADEPAGQLAVASDFSSSAVRVYYFVNGQLIEVKFAEKTWQPYSALPTFNASATATAEPTASPTGETSGTSDSGSSGLSTGAKAGIGIGVSLAALGVLGAVGALFFFRRRHSKAVAAEKAEEPHPEYGQSPPPGYPGTWEKQNGGEYGGAQTPMQQPANAFTPPSEIDSAPRQIYEMPDRALTHEMDSESTPRPAAV